MTQNKTQDVIDAGQLTALAAAAGVDAANNILEAFWKSNDDLLTLLRDALRGENFEDVAKAAHALKGSAINLGAVQLAERARCIESASRDHDVSAIGAAFDYLAGDIAAARQAFRCLLMSIAA